MQISYGITKDPQLLGEYYQVREHCYQQELQLPSFDGSEEPADRNGSIFVAKNNRQCLGGARIVGGTKELASQLLLVDLMAELDLDPGACCIWERLAVSQAYRENISQPEFCGHLINTSRSLGYDYAFMVSSVRNARFYRLCHSALDIPFKIFHHVECVPSGPFAQLEHVLSVAYLREGFLDKTMSDTSHHFALSQQPYYGVAA